MPVPVRPHKVFSSLSSSSPVPELPAAQSTWSCSGLIMHPSLDAAVQLVRVRPDDVFSSLASSSPAPEPPASQVASVICTR